MRQVFKVTDRVEGSSIARYHLVRAVDAEQAMRFATVRYAIEGELSAHVATQDDLIDLICIGFQVSEAERE